MIFSLFLKHLSQTWSWRELLWFCFLFQDRKKGWQKRSRIKWLNAGKKKKQRGDKRTIVRCRSLPGKEREERKAPLAGPLSPLWVDGVQPRMTDVLLIVPHQPPLCLLALLEFQETRSACVRVCFYAWACESKRVALSPCGAVCECKGGFGRVWIGAPKSEVPKLAKLLNTAPTVLSLKCTSTHENVQRRTFTDLKHTQIKRVQMKLST